MLVLCDKLAGECEGVMMSSRQRYAMNAAVLTDWVLDCYECAKYVAKGRGEDGAGITPEGAAIDFLVAWVSGGGTLTEFMEGGYREQIRVTGYPLKEMVEHYGLSWSVLAAWIRKDPERDRRYRAAMVDRGAMAKERLLDGWWKTAEIEVPDELATHGDVHKAREALAKVEGVFKGDVGVKGSVTITFDDVDARA